MGDVHEDPLAELALRLRTLRAQRGLQMGGLQQRTGLGRTTVSQAMNGQVVPAEATLVVLAKALGTDVEPLLALREAAARIPRARKNSPREARGGEAAGARLARWRSKSGWLDQVRDIAPAGGLVDREAELAELAGFCAGDETYAWWQAGPWAGKSALLSTFVLHPPATVEAVGFFLAPHAADASAFTDALLEQLAAVTETATAGAPAGFAARDAYRRQLMQDAAARCRAAGRSLVLVVDGLDEDRGGRPGSGVPSIASLLPRTPVEGLKIVVSSRPDPAVAVDLPADHPLRRCPVSRYATGLEHLARRELDELLVGDPLHIELLGLLAACASGLAVPELEELTGRATFEIDQPLSGPFGRTVAYRTDNTTVEPRRIATFAHETLRAEAAGRFGAPKLARYREHLHVWADVYRRQGWPETTPGYLLRGYPRLLAATADAPRLAALALDRARHERVSLMTGSAAAVFAEMQATADLVRRERPRDLALLARLAVRRHELEHRAPDLPTDLPAVWAELGRFTKAESLARAIPDPVSRVRALREVAAVMAAEGDQERADAVTRGADGQDGPPAPGGDGSALDGTEARPPAGRPEALAGLLPESDDRALALFALCDIVGQTTSDRQWAAELGHEAELIQSSCAALKAVRNRAARAVESAAAGHGAVPAAEWDEAEAEAAAVATADERVQALSVLLDACTTSGDLDRAVHLARTLRAAAAALEDSGRRTYTDQAEASLRGHPATAPDWLLRTARAADRSALLTRGATRNVRALALAALAHALDAAGRPQDARHAAAEAEEAAGDVTPPARRARTLTVLARVHVRTGAAEQATRLAEQAEVAAHLVTHTLELARSLVALARALADTGYGERAEEAASTVVRLTAVMTDPAGEHVQQISALAEVAWWLACAAMQAQAGQVVANAEAVASRIADPLAQAEALVALVHVLSAAGLSAQAADLADQTVKQAYVFSRAARQIHHVQGQLLTDMAWALSAAGQPARARDVAALISHFPSRRTALAQLEKAPRGPGPASADPLKAALAGTAAQDGEAARKAYGTAVRGDHGQAADLVAGLLATGWLTAAVPALALVDREALRVAADDLLASLGRVLA
ncbi:helix-turn-helix domain-containing protein [Streptomyces sp. NPDC018972]|uniref:helix-turn-helix domain-containing protein n=1 Tax=Streptomyces sp. NPDC018972 TaxID=3365060 RepID=UPI00378B0CA1